MTPTIFTLFKGNIQRWWPAVSFVFALNRVNIVAVSTILVLHVGMVGHHIMFPSIRASCSLAVWAMHTIVFVHFSQSFNELNRQPQLSKYEHYDNNHVLASGRARRIFSKYTVQFN